MQFRLNSKLPIQLLSVLILFSSGPGWTSDTLNVGITGGTINCVLSNAQHQTSSCTIAVPDSFIVVDIDSNTSMRLLVTAFVAYRDKPGPPRYLSEVWLFVPPDSGQAKLTFADRKVLASYKPEGGMGQRFCKRTVTCNDAIALQVEGYEAATTLLYNPQGELIEVDWSIVQKKCDCYPDYIRPITWIWTGSRSQLVCKVGEPGGQPYLLVYDLESGAIDVRSALAEVGELGLQILTSTLRGW